MVVRRFAAARTHSCHIYGKAPARICAQFLPGHVILTSRTDCIREITFPMIFYWRWHATCQTTSPKVTGARMLEGSRNSNPEKWNGFLCRCPNCLRRGLLEK